MQNSDTRRVRWYPEVIGGFTTFFTMAYILFVHPQILSEGAGMPFAAVLTGTAILCAVCTLLMGLYARLPYALAPGMGINAFFAYTLVLGHEIPWPTALGMVFWAGVLFILISVTPLREVIVRAIPASLRIGCAAGIGLFLAFIGLQNGKIVVDSPATMVTIGKLNAESLLCLLGVAIIVIMLLQKSFLRPLAFLAGIGIVTLISVLSGMTEVPKTPLSAPDFSLFWSMDLVGSLQLALVPAIVALLFTDLFDSLSTFVGVSRATGLVDEKGDPENLRQGLIVDAIGTFGASLVGSSSATTYIESASGIEAGGKTGRTAVVTGLLFIPCIFIAPLAGIVPGYATASVLIVVGILMLKPVNELKTDKLEDFFPAFLTIAAIPLTFSITQGILLGFISHAGLYLVAGRSREVSPVLWILALISIGLMAIQSSGLA